MQLRFAACFLALVALFAGCASATTSPSPSDPPTAEPTSSSSADASNPRPVVVDLDLDSSDISALAILLRDPAIDVRAILVDGTGLVHCAPGLRNVSYLLGQLGAGDIPVACGREDAGPDGRPFPADWRVGPDTAWGIDIPPQIGTGIPDDAATLLGRVLEASEEPVTIVALGPWTNLEDTFAADPALAARVARIHAMAGAVDAPGNVIVEGVTAADRLEWNVAADPSAVAAVMATTIPITIVPLDATDDVPVPSDLDHQLEPDHAAAGADLTYELLIRSPGRMTDPGQQLWDELAALAVSQPGLVTWQDATLTIAADGRMERSPRGRPVRVATAADRTATDAALLAALRRGAPRTDPFRIAGTLAVAWDGTTCSMTPSSTSPGVHLMSLANTSGKPGGVLLLGVAAPHQWSELVGLVGTMDLEHFEPPAWLIQGAQIADETGAGTTATTTVVVKPGTYGPVCAAGTWPDIAFTPGEAVAFGS